MSPLISRGLAPVRPNRHWTDEEFASRLCGDLMALDQADARFIARVRGAGLLLVVVVLMVLALAL